jgi:hypothetical protein
MLLLPSWSGIDLGGSSASSLSSISSNGNGSSTTLKDGITINEMDTMIGQRSASTNTSGRTTYTKPSSSMSTTSSSLIGGAPSKKKTVKPKSSQPQWHELPLTFDNVVMLRKSFSI